MKIKSIELKEGLRVNFKFPIKKKNRIRFCVYRKCKGSKYKGFEKAAVADEWVADTNCWDSLDIVTGECFECLRKYIVLYKETNKLARRAWLKLKEEKE